MGLTNIARMLIGLYHAPKKQLFIIFIVIVLMFFYIPSLPCIYVFLDNTLVPILVTQKYISLLVLYLCHSFILFLVGWMELQELI